LSSRSGPERKRNGFEMAATGIGCSAAQPRSSIARQSRPNCCKCRPRPGKMGPKRRRSQLLTSWHQAE
jgi:hypothetical protein